MRPHSGVDLRGSAKERGSVTRCDGQRFNRGELVGFSSVAGRSPWRPLPRVRGPLNRADRRASRPRAGDGQGVLLRPDRREGTRGQGALRGRVPSLRRVHAGAQRQGRRLRVLQTLSSRRDQAEVDAGAGDLGDAGVARALRPLPSSYDWSRTHARRRGDQALRRLAGGHWPSASVVSIVFGSRAVARQAAVEHVRGEGCPREPYDRAPERRDRRPSEA